MPSKTAAVNCGLSPRCPAVSTIDSALRLGAQAAAGALQFVIGRLFLRTARRLDLQIPLFRAPGAGGVLMGPADGGVDTHIPADQPVRVRPSPQGGQDPLPDAGTPPAPEHF
ncbi:hypothetical protein [Herbidospora yilanensis]|uniref:hypothetical protein n=1 Tax=Herbidospora yilanensis TaxID=354426 RepID=UPI0012F74D09